MFFEHLDSFINYDEIDKQQQIEINKKMSRAISKARSSCKLPYCYSCNKSTSQFCNSHYVPKFCLENIGINGEVTGPNSILKFPNTGTALLKEHIGINSSGTFQIICRDCDSKIFQEYENPKNYVIDTQLSQRILAQIAMKDYLKFISKRLFERSMYGELLNDCLSNNILNPHFIRRYDYGIKVSDIDLKIFNDGYKKAYKIANTNNTGY